MRIVQGSGLRHSGLTMERSRGYDPRSGGVGDLTTDIAASIDAASKASSGFADLQRLTFDSWSDQMQKKGYQANEIRSTFNLVYNLLPDKWRSRLTKRKPAPSGSTEPAKPPVKPPPAPPGTKTEIPWLWIGLGGVGLAGAYALSRRA